MKDMRAGEKGAISANMRLILERIPVLRDRLPDRPLSELLQQKIHVTESRIREVGGFLDRMESEVENVRQDIVRLNKKLVVAAQNEERAAEYLLQLRSVKEQAEAELAAMGSEVTAAHREKEVEIDEIKRLIWAHGGKLRLYSNAEDRIASIVKMNNNFMELLTNLHTNMQSLYDAGQEVLDELRGNLSSLTTATEASELTLEMQKSMESLKVSVNRVARLASDTSLYLTQNVDRMTSQMKIYDEETTKLVEGNLQEERNIREGKIEEVLKLAEAEMKMLKEGDPGAGNGAP
jgi:chromosome segregation ATPase